MPHAATQIQGPTLVLGGTFDPPHIGHLVLAECARHQFGAQRVVFVPAGEPYRKADREVSSATDRLAMTLLAVGGNETFVADDREIRRTGPTYSVDTLEEMHAEGHSNIVFVLGADAIADMANWKQPERIRQLATIAVAPKPGGAGLPAGNDPRVRMPPLAVSSTMVRERVRAGEPVRYLVPDAVERYIREHGLYR